VKNTTFDLIKKSFSNKILFVNSDTQLRNTRDGEKFYYYYFFFQKLIHLCFYRHIYNIYIYIYMRYKYLKDIDEINITLSTRIGIERI